MNPIQENIFKVIKPVEDSEARPAVSVIIRSTTRRVRFADQPSNGSPTARSKESGENQEYENHVRNAVTRSNTETREYSNAEVIDSATVQNERRERILTAQDEEMKWADFKAYLRREFDGLTHLQASKAGKIVLDSC